MIQTKSENYDEFVEKFEPKKTTDDFIREKKSVKKVDVIEHVRKNSKGQELFGTALHIKE